MKSYSKHVEIKALPKDVLSHLNMMRYVWGVLYDPDYDGSWVEENGDIVAVVFDFSSRVETWRVQSIGSPAYSTMLYYEIRYGGFKGFLLNTFCFIFDPLKKRKMDKLVFAMKEMCEEV